MNQITEYNEKIKLYEELFHLVQNNRNLNHFGELIQNTELLDENIASIQKLNAYCLKDFSPSLNEKDRIKKNLITELLKIGSLLVLASENHKKIEKKIEKISSLLDDISDKKLLKYTQKIISKAYNLIGNTFISEGSWSFKSAKKKIMKADLIIENYGLTYEMVKSLEEKGMSFIRYLVTIDAIKKKRKKAVEKINEHFEQIDKLLDRIDHLVISHEIKQSPFYNQYFELRNRVK